jgi:uncharacterized membrane protein
MAQAATRKPSAVRKRHDAHPTKPKPASKPGDPSTANAPRGQGGQRPGRNQKGSGSGKSDEHATEGDNNLRSLAADKLGEKLPGKLGEKLPQLLDPPDGSAPKPHLPSPHLPRPHLSIWTRLVGKILKKVAKHELRRLAKAANWSLEPIPDGAASVGDAVKSELGDGVLDIGMLKPQLPIQESIDVAVPLDFAWSEWMQLRVLPEGIGRVLDIERDGTDLSGHVGTGSGQPWSAEVLDERDRESFAWKSTEGSDCAGLVTFHSLSERLTRIELTLDVVPRDARESLQLLTHIAHWRARSELRRTKAELELVSPDVYASDEPASH